MANSTSTISKDVPWYLPGPPQLREDVKTLLSGWSGFDPANNGVEDHVEHIREEAWRVHPYPCICGYRFLNLGLQAHPLFPELVDALSSEDILFLDLGCCVGLDLRSLALAGVPGRRLTGVDLERAFIDIGYQLFCDQEKLGAKFLIIGDITDDNSHDLDSLLGRISIVWTSAFLHIWDFPNQVSLCRKILTFLNNPGVRVLGRQVGSPTPGTTVHVTNKGGRMFQHDPATFRSLWADALGHTGEVNESGVLNSRDQGTWSVKAWFEDDRPSNSPYGSVNAWLAKVSNDCHAGDKGSAAKPQASSERKVAFLVWEIQRTS